MHYQVASSLPSKAVSKRLPPALALGLSRELRAADQTRWSKPLQGHQWVKSRANSSRTIRRIGSWARSRGSQGDFLAGRFTAGRVGPSSGGSTRTDRDYLRQKGKGEQKTGERTMAGPLEAVLYSLVMLSKMMKWCSIGAGVHGSRPGEHGGAKGTEMHLAKRPSKKPRRAANRVPDSAPGSKAVKNRSALHVHPGICRGSGGVSYPRVGLVMPPKKLVPQSLNGNPFLGLGIFLHAKLRTEQLSSIDIVDGGGFSPSSLHSGQISPCPIDDSRESHFADIFGH
ncbi:hypothetical protein V8F06_005800 [Rhypophila decipiens]